MRKKLQYTCLVLLLLFMLLQLWPGPARNNNTGDAPSAINRVYTVPDTVLTIFKTACYDCHSNNSVYPWYSRLQPVKWWLNKHIEEGKKELNFDLFGMYSDKRKKNKLTSIASQVKENKMPLRSYTLMHPEADLTKHQKKIILDWVQNIQKEL